MTKVSDSFIDQFYRNYNLDNMTINLLRRNWDDYCQTENVNVCWEILIEAIEEELKQ